MYLHAVFIAYRCPIYREIELRVDLLSPYLMEQLYPVEALSCDISKKLPSVEVPCQENENPREAPTARYTCREAHSARYGPGYSIDATGNMRSNAKKTGSFGTLNLNHLNPGGLGCDDLMGWHHVGLSRSPMNYVPAWLDTN